MSTMASQIASLTSVYSLEIQVQIKENIKAPRHWLCVGNSPETGKFPAQRASNAENVSIYISLGSWECANHWIIDFLCWVAM